MPMPASQQCPLRSHNENGRKRGEGEKENKPTSANDKFKFTANNRLSFKFIYIFSNKFQGECHSIVTSLIISIIIINVQQ